MSQKGRHIIEECLKQNVLFAKWAETGSWRIFHSSHYDWWAFPIDEPSSHGTKYQVDHADLPFFLAQAQFITGIRNNAIFVCRAWGYDLKKGMPLEGKLYPDQRWQNWPIRLYKMTRSLQLFKQDDLHRNAVRYGLQLIDQGHKFHYMRDLSAYFNQFREKDPPVQTKEKQAHKEPQGKTKYTYSVVKQIVGRQGVSVPKGRKY